MSKNSIEEDINFKRYAKDCLDYMDSEDLYESGKREFEKFTWYLDKIRKEVDEAKKTFRKYQWPTIDVTRKSVEETAASIIKIYEIYKQNV